MPASFTTDIPDVESLSLDASNPESLGATWDAVLNNGQYRLEIRDDDPDGDHPPYEHEATGAHDSPPDHVIENILGGEQYSVRIRTETDYKTGSWLTVEEVTKLVPSGDISFDATSETTVDISWSINNEFRGSHLIYRQRTEYEYDDDPAVDGRLLGTVGDGNNTFTDDTAAPHTEYVYQVKTLTQWQYANSSVSDSAETDDNGLPHQAAPPRGWHVEIDHPSGQTITPQILDGVQFEPRVNDLPRVRVPVPRDGAYSLESYEGADMRVYKDGDRKPIDELEDIVTDPGQCELVGVGGTQLERRVGTNVIQQETYTLVGDLIAEGTDYATVIDEPVVEEVVDELLQAVETTGEFDEAFSPSAADPFEAIDDGLEQVQTLFLNDAGSSDVSEIVDTNAGSAIDDDELTDGRGRTIDEASDYIQFGTFTNEMDVAADDVGIGVRWKVPSGGTDISVTLYDASDDSAVGTIDFTVGSGSFGPTWDFNNSTFGSDWAGGDVPSGDYYFEVNGEENSEDSLIDLVTFFDQRFHDSEDSDDFANDLHEPAGHLDSPTLYARQAEIETSDAETIYSVLTGYATTSWSGTDGQQAIAISNDGGRSWTEVQNADTLETDFETLGASLRLRIAAGGHAPNGPRDDATPRYGYEPHRLEGYELRFDGDDTPLVINDSRDADLIDILVDYAERSDSLLEVRQDGDDTVVHWAQAGQRSSDRDLPLANYSVTKRGDRTLRCTVKGGGRSTRETVTAALDEDVAFAEENVIPGTETVRDVESEERYEYLRDYTMDNSSGTIEPLATGDIEDGQELDVEYDFKVSGTFEHADYDGDPRHDRVETINGLTTVRGCELAAKLIVDTTSTPRWEADVEIPAGEHVDRLLEAFDVDGVAGEAMSVYDLDVSAGQLSARLGSRKRAEDAIRQIRSTVSATSDRV
ncbi:fibronectin type III domain-containing protein [Natronorubrum sp. FCH18a]|uniref:fibronectin type III domain-containing protein n=1 Tax=Natronorubrum sp. FCH18a TaxID=3447018 RepID=UPI003F513235